MEPPAPPRIFDGNANPIDNRGMSSKDIPHKGPPAGGNGQISPLNCPADAGSALTPIMQGAHLAQRQPGMYAMVQGQVMTDKQLDTLRRQISVYATICKQLVEMHKAMVAQQNSLSGLRLGQSVPYDPAVHAVGQKFASRQRWTPSQTQIQFLEKLFEQGSGTPTKQRIKEITQELSQYGPISETNVYNWFQNRRARSKRKQQVGGHNNGESEFDTDGDSPEEKRAKLERDLSNESFGAGPVELHHQSGDSGEHQQFDMQKGPRPSSFQQLETSKGPETLMIHTQQDHISFSANRAHRDDHGFAPSSMAGSFPLMSFRAWDAAAQTQDAKTGHVATSMPQEFSAKGKNEQ